MSFPFRISEIFQGCRTHAPLLICGAILTVVMVFCHNRQPLILKFADYKIYDLLLAGASQTPASELPVIVDIDEASLARYGQWPWPRYRIAQLLQSLNEMGVLSVGIDFVFAEPDRTSPGRLRIEMSQDLGLDIGFTGVPPPFMDNDAILAQVLAQGPFVLGYSFLFDQSGQGDGAHRLHPGNIFIMRGEGVADNETFLFKPSAMVANIEKLASAAPSSGFFNVRPDADGILRQVPLLMEYNGRIYPNLSLATLIMAIQPEQLIVKVSANGPESLLIEDRVIPLTGRGNMLVHFRKEEGSPFSHISAAAVLDGTVDPQQLANRIVFLGTSAKGLQDITATPFNPVFPGVNVHATIIDNIIRDDFISRPHWVFLAEFSAICVVGLISTVLLAWTRALWGGLLLVGCSLLLWGGSLWLFKQAVYLSPIYPVMTLVVNFSVLTLFKYWREEKKVLAQTKELNKIQAGVIQVMKASNLKLEGNAFALEQKIEDRTAHLNDAIEMVGEANQKISDSLNYAFRIQKSLLPTADEIKAYLPESFIIWEPRDIVSGDIYFSCPVSEGFILAVIDCTGHGIPGALLTMIAISSLRKITVIEGCHDPALILKKLNHSIKTTLRQDTDGTVADDGLEISLCLVSRNENRLIFAGARQSLICMTGDELRVIKGDKNSLGYRQSKRSDINFNFTNHIIFIERQTSFYLYTDGYVDQLGGEQGLPFGQKRFRALLQEIGQFPFDKQSEIFLRTFAEYVGNNKRLDDATVLGFSIRPSQSAS